MQIVENQKDADLDAWSWLPFHQWTPDRIFNDDIINGKRYCKIDDEWIASHEVEAHCARLIETEKERRARRKEEGQAAGLEAAHEARRTKAAEKKDKPAPVKTAVVRRGRKVRKAVELTIPDGEFTIAQVAGLSGADVNDVRKAIVTRVASGEFTQVGTVKSGGRGRPAVLYARNKS
jgi:hypothetical protein